MEDEKLFLPSDFDAATRRAVGAFALGVEEGKLREGEAFDALHATRNACKALVAMNDRHVKNDKGTAANTKAVEYLRQAAVRRDSHIATYNRARATMIQLGMFTEDDASAGFPLLTVPDTRMKSRQQKRQAGDSRRTDGSLWRIGAIGTPSRPLLPIDSPDMDNSTGRFMYSVSGFDIDSILLQPCTLPKRVVLRCTGGQEVRT